MGVKRLSWIAIAMVVLTALPTGAAALEHGGSMTNTHNDLSIVAGDAGNPLGLLPGTGNVVVKELISFESDDPLKVPDYGIVYIPPQFTIDTGYPKLVSYMWEFNVKNYTVVLRNDTDEFVWNITGVAGETVSIDPGDLGPDEPTGAHPKVNATYNWSAEVVNDHGSSIMAFIGGQVTLDGAAATVIDLSPLGLPPLGDNTYEPDAANLAGMSRDLVLEKHLDLKDGFYRLRIGDMAFELGVRMMVEVRYHAMLGGDDRVKVDKLLFTSRQVHIDVYIPSDMEVKAFDTALGQGIPLSPTSVSGGQGEPTSFSATGSFRVELGPPGEEATDWAKMGRYALLTGLIVVLLALILWSPRRGKGEGEDIDGDEGEGEDEEEHGDEDDDEVEDERVALVRTGLEERKAELLEGIRDLDDLHDDGELDDEEWEARRAELKAEAVSVMKALDDLG
jgi:hypothetical protein